MAKKYGLTLIELLITVLLVGMIVLSFVSVQRFAFHNIIASERRAKLQNEAYLIMEHITKSLAQARGNPYCGTGPTSGCAPFTYGPISGLYYLVVRFDDGGTPANLNDDYFARYMWTNATGADIRPCSSAYSLQYCPNLTGGNFIISPTSSNCAVGGVDLWEALSCGKVYNFTVWAQDNATVGVNLTMRHKPGDPPGIDNPEVSLSSSIHIPSAPAR